MKVSRDRCSLGRSGEDRPDISRADFTFCLLAINWGWGVEETATRLLQESGKAQENGEATELERRKSGRVVSSCDGVRESSSA